jgi:hypothetical protein
MADIERLKDIASDMISHPDTYRDGVEVARAAYELQRIREIIAASLTRPSMIDPKGERPSYSLALDPEDD